MHHVRVSSWKSLAKGCDSPGISAADHRFLQWFSSQLSKGFVNQCFWLVTMENPSVSFIFNMYTAHETGPQANCISTTGMPWGGKGAFANLFLNPFPPPPLNLANILNIGTTCMLCTCKISDVKFKSIRYVISHWLPLTLAFGNLAIQCTIQGAFQHLRTDQCVARVTREGHIRTTFKAPLNRTKW